MLSRIQDSSITFFLILSVKPALPSWSVQGDTDLHCQKGESGQFCESSNYTRGPDGWTGSIRHADKIWIAWLNLEQYPGHFQRKRDVELNTKHANIARRWRPLTKKMSVRKNNSQIQETEFPILQISNRKLYFLFDKVKGHDFRGETVTLSTRNKGPCNETRKKSKASSSADSWCRDKKDCPPRLTNDTETEVS